MKKLSVIIIILSAVICFGTEWHVVSKNSQHGDIETGAGTEGDPFIFISSAIGAAQNNDVIILDGTFTLTDDTGAAIDPYVITSGDNSGLNIIEKSITLRGVNRETTIVQAGNTPRSELIKNRVFYAKASVSSGFKVCLENLTIRNGRGEPTGGIYARGANLKITNCVINDNETWDDPTVISSELNMTHRGGGGVFVNWGNLEIYNSVIKNNINIARGHYKVGGEGGGICFFPWIDLNDAALTINNCSILDNLSEGPGGGVSAFVGDVNTKVNIINSTFSGNAGSDGHAIRIVYAPSKGTLDATMNSCTIVDNNSGFSGHNTSSILLEGFTDAPLSSFDIRNSLVKNYEYYEILGITNQNFYPNDPGATPFTRSYTISDDTSIPFGEINNNIDLPADYSGPLITALKNEQGTSFYKILEGSPAKDAIPNGNDGNNSYNGAPYVVSAENDTTWYDQRGFNLWNQAKDIGAYESPYYWVDVTADDDDYKTIPRWKTDLRIADQTEYNLAPEEEKWKWTDYMRAQTGGRIILTENSEIERFDKSELKWNNGSFMDVNANSRIINGLDFVSGANINVLDDAQLALQLTTATVPANASMTIGKNAKLIIENGTNLIFDDGATVRLSDGAEIIVSYQGRLETKDLTSDRVTFISNTDIWKGIICEVGSSISISGTDFIGAITAIAGTPTICTITNSQFTECTNGISLINCTDYTLSDNTLYGKGIGTGITLTHCSAPIINNITNNFQNGVKLVASSVILAKNLIADNLNNGLYITGHGSKPVLVNAVTKDETQKGLNNDIINNCSANPYNGGQIFMSYSAGVYMNNGYNNVYGSLHCIKGVVRLMPNEPVINRVLIQAEANYWGLSSIGDDTSNMFSFERLNNDPNTGYFIDFEPYAQSPYTGLGTQLPRLSSNEPRSNESILLYNALKLEQLDNLKPSIKLYEQIIKKFVGTPEYFVAMTRLPQLYISEGITLNSLMTEFDDAINTDENELNRKFFKSLKISTNIKSKNYETAIMLAEEMKAEAQCEDEAMLADIDIEVAKLMKEAENKGKADSSSDYLNKLLAKLNGSDVKEDTDRTTEIINIPTENKLYQNYPNPFNPVTQIKFDLAKSAKVKLSVYNISGQLVAELANGVLNAGHHAVDFDGSKFNSGIYYYNLITDGKNITKKMVLTK